MTSHVPIAVGHGGRRPFGGDDGTLARLGVGGELDATYVTQEGRSVFILRQNKPAVHARAIGCFSLGASGRTGATNTPASARPASQNLVDAIRELFAPLGGVDLDTPPRELVREPPSFDG